MVRYINHRIITHRILNIIQFWMNWSSWDIYIFYGWSVCKFELSESGYSAYCISKFENPSLLVTQICCSLRAHDMPIVYYIPPFDHICLANIVLRWYPARSAIFVTAWCSPPPHAVSGVCLQGEEISKHQKSDKMPVFSMLNRNAFCFWWDHI